MEEEFLEGVPVGTFPVRMCVICRQRFAKRDVRRYVLSCEGEPCLDPTKTMPGRGWYLCDNPDCVRKFANYRWATRRKGVKK